MKKYIETIKKDQSGITNAKDEIKNTLEGISSRWDESEDWISDWEDEVEKNHPSEQKRKKQFLQK